MSSHFKLFISLVIYWTSYLCICLQAIMWQRMSLILCYNALLYPTVHVDISNGFYIELVDEFWYLGTVNADGVRKMVSPRCEVIALILISWLTFQQLWCGKVYSSAVRGCMLYGGAMWLADEERKEMALWCAEIGLICDVKLNWWAVGSRPSDHYFCSVCLFVCLSVCLCRVFLSRLWSDFDQTWAYVICQGLVLSPRI